MPKSILVATPFNSTWAQPFRHALRQLGCTAVFFDYRNLIGTLRFHPWLYTKLLFQHPSWLTHHRLKLLNRLLTAVCRQLKPDYLLVIKGETLTAATINAINKLGITTLLWQVDPVFDPSIWRYSNTVGRAYQVYITCEPEPVLTQLKNKSFSHVTYMLGAADGTVMRQLHSPKKYDVTLVGTHHPNRVKYLQALRGLDVHVWGWGAWQKSPVSSMYHGKSLTQSQLLKVYAQSKIIVNIDRNPSSPIPTNLRCFEAAQVGGFILTDCKPNLKQVFKIGQEIDCFTTPQDLRRKVEFYLAHPSSRRHIARNMFARVKKNHTYVARLKTLFSQLSSPQHFGRHSRNHTVGRNIFGHHRPGTDNTHPTKPYSG